MPKPFLSIERLTQKFPDGQGGTLTVFENATFGIEKGEFVCILGHSGCGKSTIMNILAGLAEPTSGVVKMDGTEVSGPSLDRGVVFQNYSLLPWLSTLKNVTFGVKARYPDWSKAKVEEHAREYLAMVGLEGDVVQRKPSQLSGGMRQRVSIARAFANHPKLLLLDEPFGALDALTRGTIQDELLKIWGGTEQTVSMITHDIDEAILLADRILLMTNGPFARVAESVEITIPRPRSRTEIVEHPNYYAIRNHLVQFLGQRSKELAGQKSDDPDQRPETVRIDKTAAEPATEAAPEPEPARHLQAVND
ncbi:ABC transporter ATP-binding protein [Phaeobacter gallaeciensis]|uniref:ABC transporter ATP-binding protein n=1 Tax=Phaeobacter gallaeciensis TaxID=60890 RepID=UPI00237F1FF1|nr:ABC transporter ATP-binding protein [Phaeobacter gallaeciensis]MDE4096799.1 ABC transporter ATP-binding protein [Phaeobacter gallaeciensis]MDE4105907.1 ABC transporter ATP-binding protein [Phaeobacter gallaeciensis]MDE4110066.1 ABC transporter ATP-binding protein [Phaeobacter gallaeciensis]MDE4114534.1 ABC transporter ATP-binding protein [Phaeobacter gallaeciensis]MDE4119300.1 ABC transporter ATP-binding protein [Phaeobacter gallaeciensis]